MRESSCTWNLDELICNCSSTGAIGSQGSIIRATRAAKLGARYGRLTRLLRFIRFLRFIPCLSFLGGDDDFEPTMSAIKKVSNELSSVISLRVAALVMIIVIIVPFLNYTVTEYSPNAWITNMKLAAKNESVTEYEIENLIRKCNNFYKPKPSRLFSVEVESPFLSGPIHKKYRTRDVLRESNLVRFESAYLVANDTLAQSTNPNAVKHLLSSSASSSYAKFEVKILVDYTTRNQFSSLYGILIIILVIVVLFSFTASFNAVVNQLVVKPLEKMMGTLRNSAMVMLKSLRPLEQAAEEKEGEGKQKKKCKQTNRSSKNNAIIAVAVEDVGKLDDLDDELVSDEESDCSSNYTDEELETEMLEKMVEKRKSAFLITTAIEECVENFHYIILTRISFAYSGTYSTARSSWW